MIICVISLPFFIYPVPYELNVEHPHTRKSGEAGETVEFKIDFQMEGGHTTRVINLETRDETGNWEIEPKDTSFQLEPDSSWEIIIKCHIPEDTRSNTAYWIEYRFNGDYGTNGRQLSVIVRDSRFPVTDGREQSSSKSGNDLGLSPLVFIPESIIVASAVLLIVLIKNNPVGVKKYEQ
jgi:hypothetical protein